MAYEKNMWVHTWSATDIFFLKSWSPILFVQIPSIQIPPSGSDNLKRAAVRELFPAPDLPTMPTCKETQGDERLNRIHRNQENPDCWRWILKGPADILNQIIHCWGSGACPVYCRMINSSYEHTRYPLDATPKTVATKYDRNSQMSLIETTIIPRIHNINYSDFHAF